MSFSCIIYLFFPLNRVAVKYNTTNYGIPLDVLDTQSLPRPFDTGSARAHICEELTGAIQVGKER